MASETYSAYILCEEPWGTARDGHIIDFDIRKMSLGYVSMSLEAQLQRLCRLQRLRGFPALRLRWHMWPVGFSDHCEATKFFIAVDLRMQMSELPQYAHYNKIQLIQLLKEHLMAIWSIINQFIRPFALSSDLQITGAPTSSIRLILNFGIACWDKRYLYFFSTLQEDLPVAHLTFLQQTIFQNNSVFESSSLHRMTWKT